MPHDTVEGNVTEEAFNLHSVSLECFSSLYSCLQHFFLKCPTFYFYILLLYIWDCSNLWGLSLNLLLSVSFAIVFHCGQDWA